MFLVFIVALMRWFTVGLQIGAPLDLFISICIKFLMKCMFLHILVTMQGVSPPSWKIWKCSAKEIHFTTYVAMVLCHYCTFDRTDSPLKAGSSKCLSWWESVWMWTLSTMIELILQLWPLQNFTLCFMFHTWHLHDMSKINVISAKCPSI